MRRFAAGLMACIQGFIMPHARARASFPTQKTPPAPMTSPEDRPVSELHESEERFRRLSALSADAYWEQDEEFRFTSFSNSISQALEPGRAQYLIGKKRWELGHVNMSEADWAAHRALLEARQPFRDLELCRYDVAGRKVWIRVSGEPVLDAAGVFKGYHGITTNITERRRAEELRELEHAVTRILADTDSVAGCLQRVIRAVCETEDWDCGRYFRVDEQAIVLRFAEGWGVPDAAVERFLALSREIVYRPGLGLSGVAWQTGKPVWSADVVSDPRASKGAAKVGSREIGIHAAFVFPIVSRGVTIGVLNFSSRKAREPEERLLQAIAVIGGQIGQFVQRRQAEEQRQVLEAQLRQAQKTQAIGTLATGIAHEFNNVLRAILANVELARMDIEARHPARESVEEIAKASRHARDIVQRILAFARPQAPLRRRIVLSEVAEEAVGLLGVTLPAGIELTVDFSAETPEVLADETQIQQLLVNLCTNAWQAMSGRSGRIRVRLAGVTLETAGIPAAPGLKPGRFARLSVSDSGAGIDPEIRERIFDPFFSTKSVGEGTGLGLTVVHSIVQAHEGAIDVDSQVGKGTTFHIYLPEAQPSVAQEVVAAAPPARTHGGGRHVLFLDDNGALVSAMVRMLSRHGYRVSGHTVAEEALDAVRAAPHEYDLFVSDAIMPRWSGLDVARELSKIRPDLPIAIFAGHIDAELVRKARALGIRQLLNKLNASEELLDAIDRLTGER
jgi:PAS domain S-box-containing protein